MEAQPDELQLERLLASPEALKNLPSIIADIEARKAASLAHLSDSMAGQVAEVRAALELLDGSKKTVNQLRGNFQTIDQLCEECSSLIENHDTIEVLNTVLANLNNTIEHVERTRAIPEEARAALELVKEHGDLLPAFEAMLAVDSQREMVLKAITDGIAADKDAAAATHKLAHYFEEVDTVMESLERQLFAAAEDFLRLGCNEPAVLVRMVQVVVLQEAADASRPVATRKRYRQRFFDAMTRAIDRDFEHQLNPRDPRVETELQYALERAQLLCTKLTPIYDHVVPCFPPAYEPFAVLVSAYHRQLGSLLERLARKADGHPNQAILQVVKWVALYSELLQDLGLSAEEAALLPRSPAPVSSRMAELSVDIPGTSGAAADSHIASPTAAVVSLEDMLGSRSNPFLDTPSPAGKQANVAADSLAERAGVGDTAGQLSQGLQTLCAVYVRNMEQSMQTWYKNILQADTLHPPKQSEDGRCWTPAAVDLFGLLNDQLAMVREVDTGYLLFQVACTCARVMVGSQALQRELLQATPLAQQPLEQLAAVVNNNVRCYDLASDLYDTLEEALSPAYHELLDRDTPCNGFLDVSKAALQRLADGVFHDPAVADLFSRLYTKDWIDGSLTASLVATLQDYFEDLERWLDSSFYKRLAAKALERCIGAFAERLLDGRSGLVLRVEAVEQMEADEEALLGLFERHLNHAQVVPHITKLGDLRELASATDNESFMLSYQVVLRANPAVTPQVVDRLLASREDISRSDRAEAVKTCQEVYEGMLLNAR